MLQPMFKGKGRFSGFQRGKIIPQSQQDGNQNSICLRFGICDGKILLTCGR
jgi:hypothetical protein